MALPDAEGATRVGSPGGAGDDGLLGGRTATLQAVKIARTNNNKIRVDTTTSNHKNARTTRLVAVPRCGKQSPAGAENLADAAKIR